jgi:hypothetical protein
VSPRISWPKLTLAAGGLGLGLGLLLLASWAVERLEERQVVETARPDDRVQFVDEALFRREGDRWVTTAYAHRFAVPSSFAADKGDRWRLFALGGSFMMGTPYVDQVHGEERAGGIPGFLRAQLSAASLDREIEIINMGAGAQDSHRVRRIAEIVVDHEPDALLVATCNNEGVLAPSRLRELLHRQGGYRLLARLLTDPGGEGRPLYTPQDPDLAALGDQFRANLAAIVALCRERGIPLFLATLPQNLRYTGLEHGHGPGQGEVHDPGEDPCVQPARTMVEQGRPAEALAALEGCDHVADALRWAGLARLELGEHEPARVHLQQSLELAPRNRCRGSFEGIIRAQAGDGVTLVDLQRAARDASPHGIPGPELFLDSCHMSWRGYGLMAEEAARTILASGQGLAGSAASPTLPQLDDLAAEQGLTTAMLELEFFPQPPPPELGGGPPPGSVPTGPPPIGNVGPPEGSP